MINSINSFLFILISGLYPAVQTRQCPVPMFILPEAVHISSAVSRKAEQEEKE
jgi:hypothetical protein